MTNSPTRVPLLPFLVALGAATALRAAASPFGPAPCPVPSFAAGVPLPVPPETTYAAFVGIGDVNGDGAADVALSAPQEGAILLFRNDGRGGFSAVEKLPVGTTSFTALLADVDGDGRSDVVAVRAMPDTSPFLGSLAVWRSTGTGFLPPPATEAVLSASSFVPLFADVDGDGRGDLLLFAAAGSPSDSPRFSWLRNLGDGLFSAPTAIPAAEGYAVQAAADVDGDGHVDLVASQYDTVASGQLRILSGNGAGGFAAGAGFGPGLPVNDVVVADLDRDGRPDLVVSRNYKFLGVVETLVADGSGGFRSTFSFDATAPSVAAGDVDRDGTPDLVVSSPATSVGLSVFPGNGAGGFPRRYALEPESGKIALADFDRDGAPDLLRVPGSPPNPAWVLRNNCKAGEASRTLLVPVVASLPGANGVRYETRLTLTNRSPATAVVEVRFTPAEGTGGGTGMMTLAGDGQTSVDAGALLASLGILVPDPARLLGTLRLTATSLVEPGDFASEAWVSVTRAGDLFPSSGVSFPAIPVEEAFDGAVLLGGLREDGRDRTNLGLVHAGGPVEPDVVLRVTLFPGDPSLAAPVVLPDVRLAAGKIRQLDRVLRLAGLSSPHAFARVERVSGTSRFFAYAVVNDEGSSDGSFLAAVPAGAGRLERRLVVPSVVEAGAYTTDLFVSNASPVAKSVRLEWVASGLWTPGGSVVLPLALPPSSQILLDDFVEHLRESGVEGVPPRGGTLAGALFASVDDGNSEGLLVGSRVTTPAAGAPGRYGVFVAAALPEDMARASAFLPVSQPACIARTNLAIVNAAEAGTGSSVFRVDVWDGAARELIQVETGLVVPERGFVQLSPLVPPCAPNDRELVVTVTRTGGDAPFLAYAVVNDGGRPGEGTGDGAVIGMRVEPSPPGTAARAPR